ncbi:MAG TPA: DUF389 domain-containing protein [Flavisolibacter sp.]|nr:DUF389 domain-containing protein [Flavisolibacter sp.]
MHRSIEIAAPAPQIESLVIALKDHPLVINVVRIRGAAIKPAGDALQLEVLNRGADDVMKMIKQYVIGSNYTVITGEVSSMNNPALQHKINDDVDEAIWEELETGLRHNGCITPNFLLLMGLAGVIASIGYVSFLQMQVGAFIAASIIAPGLEPIAKLPLGIMMGKKEIFFKGLRATLVGYAVLMGAAAGTFALLNGIGEVDSANFLENEVTQSLLHIKVADVMMSVAAAAAAIIMYLSYRRHVIAGPLIALILIPATTAIAMFAVLGKWQEVWNVLGKSAVEIAVIIVVGCLLIWTKQKWVHRRKPIS